jgi:hypothetical protein
MLLYVERPFFVARLPSVYRREQAQDLARLSQSAFQLRIGSLTHASYSIRYHEAVSGFRNLPEAAYSVVSITQLRNLSS